MFGLKGIGFRGGKDDAKEEVVMSANGSKHGKLNINAEIILS